MLNLVRNTQKYLRGMAVIGKKSFTIFPEGWSESFGPDIYESGCIRLKERLKMAGGIQKSPYGWTVGLCLPTRETVEATIAELEQEMEAN